MRQREKVEIRRNASELTNFRAPAKQTLGPIEGMLNVCEIGLAINTLRTACDELDSIDEPLRRAVIALELEHEEEINALRARKRQT
jgi:hypothetical protein